MRNPPSKQQFQPEEDNDEPDYWALFVSDPEGMRVEIAHLAEGPPDGDRYFSLKARIRSW